MGVKETWGCEKGRSQLKFSVRGQNLRGARPCGGRKIQKKPATGGGGEKRAGPAFQGRSGLSARRRSAPMRKSCREGLREKGQERLRGLDALWNG